MGDELWIQTQQLFTDYLEFCTREPGTPGHEPRTREAAMLRTAAEELRRRYPGYFERYHDYSGDNVALLDMLLDTLLPGGFNPSWLRVVTSAALAGALLERRRGSPRADLALQSERLAGRLTARFAGQHRAWIEAQGGWDGFCISFRGPLPLSYWKAQLFQTFLSCVLATVLIYLWTRVYRFL